MIEQVNHWRTECDRCGSFVTSKTAEFPAAWQAWTTAYDTERKTRHFCPACATYLTSMLTAKGKVPPRSRLQTSYGASPSMPLAGEPVPPKK